MSISVHERFVEWGTSGGVLQHGEEAEPFSLQAMSYSATEEFVAEVEVLVTEGHSLRDAIAAAKSSGAGGRERTFTLGNDAIVVDGTDIAGAGRAVDLLKTVRGLTERPRRILVATGAIGLSGDSDYDSLEALGAVMVRLNVDLVVAVGPTARSIFLSVGREGSWDGESQHCDDVARAYDVVHAYMGPGDVLVVIGGVGESLAPLRDLVVGGAA